MHVARAGVHVGEHACTCHVLTCTSTCRRACARCRLKTRHPGFETDLGACSFSSSPESFFDIDDVYNRTTVAGKHQPALYKFIADTIWDFDEDDLDGFDLFTLFYDVQHNCRRAA